MENELWFKPDLDLDKVLNEKKYELLIEYADENQRQLVLKAKRNDTDELNKSLKLGTALLRYLEKQLELKKRKYTVFKLGELSGSIDVLNQLFYEKEQQTRTISVYRESLKCVKHLDSIVALLDTYGSLTHSEISEKLEINPPTLTEIMKKVLPTMLVNVSSFGKYKLYSLTDAGRRISLSIRKEKANNIQLEEIIDQLKRYSRQTNDTKEIQKHINEFLSELSATTIMPGDKVSLDYRDFNDNPRNLEFSVCSINNNSDETINIKGTLEQEAVFPQIIENFLKNERKDEHGVTEKVTADIGNIRW